MNFFKRHKVWSVILGIVVVVVVGFSIFWLVKSIAVNNTDCPTERRYVDFMTGGSSSRNGLFSSIRVTSPR